MQSILRFKQRGDISRADVARVTVMLSLSKHLYRFVVTVLISTVVEMLRQAQHDNTIAREMLRLRLCMTFLPAIRFAPYFSASL